MDLRKKLSLPAVADTKYTSIVVVHVEKLEMGLKVDTVSEVMDIERNAIEPSPDFGNQSHLDFVLGMGKTENGVRILLNISQILSSQEILDITELKNSDLN
jgi:purine-binding chemotaxis protein CheW